MPPQRTVNGETREWNGSTWVPVQQQPADTGYHPGLADSEHPWLARIKGFLSGAAEAATPAKLGTLAALSTGGASIPAQMATSAGAEALAEALQVATGSPNAPKSLGDAATRLAVGTGLTGALGAAGKGVQAIREAGGPVSAGLDVASHLPVVGKYAAALKALRSLAPEGASAAEDVVQPLAAQIRQSAEVPGSSYPPASTFSNQAAYDPSMFRPAAPAAPAARVVGKAPTLEDTLANTLQGLRGARNEASTVSGAPAQTLTTTGKPAVPADWYESQHVPEFSFEGSSTGRPDELPPPGLTVGEAGSNPLSNLEDAQRAQRLSQLDTQNAQALNDQVSGANQAAYQREAATNPDTDEFRRMEAARAGLESDSPTFTDWSKQIDDIINGAGPEDFPTQNATGIARSRLNKSDADWLARTGPRGTELAAASR